MSDASPTRRVFVGAALAGTATLAVAGSFPSRPAPSTCPTDNATGAATRRRRPAEPGAGDAWWREPFRC